LQISDWNPEICSFHLHLQSEIRSLQSALNRPWANHSPPFSLWYLANRREIPPRPMPFRSFLKKRDRGTFRAPRWLQSSS